MPWLIPLSGPTIEPFELLPTDNAQTLGRHEACELVVPPQTEQVSRRHAKFDFDGQHWQVTDLASRWGTFVGGVKLEPQQAFRIREGDVIRIAPWTFSFSSTLKKRGLHLRDDVGQTVVRSVDEKSIKPLAESLLTLLLESTTKIHASTTDVELANNVIEAAIKGTGLTNAVMLRPIAGLESFEVLASRVSNESADAPAYFSRSLITAASNGHVAEVSVGSGADFAMSLVQMNVSAAICVPLMLGGAAAAFLYLDARGSVIQPLRANGSAFCVGLSRVASLALANIKRVEIEQRQAQISAELNAAAAAQKWIMPTRRQTLGPLTICGDTKPGQFVGGDFFDVIPLDNARVAIALGDVSGKGVSASVLMTATQGFFNASIAHSSDPALAVTRLNKFVAPRRPSSRFVTLWAGVIDPSARTLTYVDAAHSYAIIQRSNGTFDTLNLGDGLPLGVMDDGVYASTSVAFNPGDTLIVVSDGIIEQPRGDSTTDDRDQFEVAGVQHILAQFPSDVVEAIFHAVIAHAGTDQLADDATVVYVSWNDQ